MISDLEKGFEKVVHSNIAEAAGRYRFPVRILKLALDMYRAARRIKCGDALCQAAFTEQGVLAGCPIAMGALCLAILDPMVKFRAAKYEGFQMAKVYVDDFAISFQFNRNSHSTDLIRMKVANAYRELEAAIMNQGANFAKGKGKIVA